MHAVAMSQVCGCSNYTGPGTTSAPLDAGETTEAVEARALPPGAGPREARAVSAALPSATTAAAPAVCPSWGIMIKLLQIALCLAAESNRLSFTKLWSNATRSCSGCHLFALIYFPLASMCTPPPSNTDACQVKMTSNVIPERCTRVSSQWILLSTLVARSGMSSFVPNDRYQTFHSCDLTVPRCLVW